MRVWRKPYKQSCAFSNFWERRDNLGKCNRHF
nr:MAG TPA: hypothetical protein [Caudoviricetes sp.]